MLRATSFWQIHILIPREALCEVHAFMVNWQKKAIPTVLCPALGYWEQERHRAPEASPAEGNKDD